MTKKIVRIVESKTPAGTSIWTPIVTRGGKLIDSMQSEHEMPKAFEKANREHCGMDDEPKQPVIEYFDGPTKVIPMAFPVAWLYAATAGIVVVCVLVALFGFK